MPIELSQQRPSVAFDMTTGGEIEFDLASAMCILDIRSNEWINMGQFGLDEFQSHGNFSGWVGLRAGEGVAVSGLASCGAVFLADQDFGKVAAGHMSGHGQFVEGWCRKLMQSTTPVRPRFILWGSGPQGRRADACLRQYMSFFDIPLSRVHVVDSCGAIFLARAQRGIAYANHHGALQVNRSGQAVREGRAPVPEEEMTQRFFTFHDTYNSATILDQFLLIQAIADVVQQPRSPFTMDEETQKREIATRGKTLTKAYYDMLPAPLKARFQKFAIFELHPDWRG